ncbi:MULTISPECIES: VOC family protein [unclassified Streptomyces]|uniref:VOC family protein n=1 Tax=unclassified Streptomyces TaxID=2593676 RepID=UPI0004BE73FC|nr:VOC family protein [Streptomyces sp. NRRL S-87]
MSFLNPVRHINFDARDPYRLAEFWAAVTGYALDPTEKGDPEVLLDPQQPGAPGILFCQVPEEKSGKNRVHLDIQPPTGTRDEEVARLLELGARIEDDRRTSEGMGWVVMSDPEGNEFCVERSAVERGLV